MYLQIRTLLLCFATAIFCVANCSSALCDQVIVDEGSNRTPLGDFDCSSFHDSMGQSFPLDSGEITAGQLWTFFHSQGIQKLDRIVLSVDVAPLAGKSDVDLDAIDLVIENSDRGANSKFSLGKGNNLILPNYGASSFQPEAQLEIQLGYDFMDKFDRNSTEKIVLNYTTANGTIAVEPKFAIGGRSSLLSMKNVVWLGLFAVFWIVVFVALFKLTKPTVDAGEEKPAKNIVPSA